MTYFGWYIIEIQSCLQCGQRQRIIHTKQRLCSSLHYALKVECLYMDEDLESLFYLPSRLLGDLDLS